MTADPSSMRPSGIIKLTVRIFGGMLIFMGAVSQLSLVGVFQGELSNIAGVIVGLLMLAAGIKLIRVSRRIGPSLDEKLLGVRRNPDTGALEAVDETQEVFVDTYSAPGVSGRQVFVRKKVVDEHGKPVASMAVQRRYRIDDRGRFVVGRDRSLIQMALGMLFLGVAFFYSNGQGVWTGREPWEIDFISVMVFLVGLISVVAGGLAWHVVLDRRNFTIRREWKWLFFRFAKEHPLHKFHHVVVRRSISQTSGKHGSTVSRSTEVDYEVRLAGDVSFRIARFEVVFDARDLAKLISDYSGFTVREDL